MKIGQIMTMTKDFEIECALGGDIKKVKKGDEGFINSKSQITYISGEARGMILGLSDVEVESYANEDIAYLIFKSLNSECGLNEICSDYNRDKKIS